MAETTKRTTNISAIKHRKSRNDLVGTAIEMYLDEKNFSSQSDELALTQSIEEYDISMMLDSDVAKVNSILYSNVLGLSNNPAMVDQQFSKFVKFVQTQNMPAIKSELQALLWPLVCHIYIEMIKGRDSRPATEFLRKYAHLFGPIENLSKPVVKNVNGSPNNDEEEQHDLFVPPPLPSATTKISFVQEDSAQTNGCGGGDDDNEDRSDYFRELVSSLSLCLRIDELESIEITRKFRNAKYDMLLSLQALYALKHFMGKHGHVVILHILQTWFSFEIREALIDSDADEVDLDSDADEVEDLVADGDGDCDSNGGDDDDGGGSASGNSGHGVDMNSDQSDSACDSGAENSDTAGNNESGGSSEEGSEDGSDNDDGSDGSDGSDDGEGSDVCDGSDDCDDASDNSSGKVSNSGPLPTYSNIKNLLKKIELETRIINRIDNTEIMPRCNSNNSMIEPNEQHDAPGNDENRTPMINGIGKDDDSYIIQNKYLQNIRASVIKSRRLERPIRVFNVLNADNRLCTGTLDSGECHMACGFDDSTIRIWQLNHSRLRGRKPFATLASRICEWCLNDCPSSSEENDSDEEDDEHVKWTIFKDRQLFGNGSHNYAYLNSSKKRQRREHEKQFKEKRCDENIFSDFGGLPLRGHSKGVTDVLFSAYTPLMFSVSKDTTMRAWRASDYTCGAIYRGHNYPIWCVAESSTGLYVATGSRDSTARLWSTDREFPLQTYIGHTQDVDAIAFHPNGNYIATGSTDLTVRLWDVTSGKLLRIFTDCRMPVHCVSFSPDGKYLAAAGEELTIRIFDLASSLQLVELKEHSSTVNSIAWNAKSTKLLSGCIDGTVRVFSVAKSISHSFIGEPELASTSTTSSLPSINPMISNETSCNRVVKVYFNVDESATCIGNT